MLCQFLTYKGRLTDCPITNAFLHGTITGTLTLVSHYFSMLQTIMTHLNLLFYFLLTSVVYGLARRTSVLEVDGSIPNHVIKLIEFYLMGNDICYEHSHPSLSIYHLTKI